MEFVTRLNPTIESAGTRGGESNEGSRFEQLQPSWFGCFVGAWGGISLSFIAAQSTPMGWKEGEFIIHIYSNTDIQYFFFQHQNQ